MNDLEWKIVYTTQGLKDKEQAIKGGFKEKILPLLALLRKNPYAQYPPYEKLIGELNGAYSRRINHQHRLVYTIHDKERTVKVISMWEHYA
jgi:toxin YoeB